MSRSKLSLASCLLFFVLLACLGCSKPAVDAPPDQAAKPAHDHPAEGPHGGHLIEFGDEAYHGELTHDDKSSTVTVYLLGPDAKTMAHSTDMEVMLNLVVDGKTVQAKLASSPQPEDPEGQSSRYTLVDEKVLEALENPKTTGRLNVNIGGKSYSGPLALGEHGHDHK